MGQEDILNYLREHPDKWFTCRELARLLGTNQSTCSTSLRKLRKAGAIHQKASRRDIYHIMLYKYKNG